MGNASDLRLYVLINLPQWWKAKLRAEGFCLSGKSEDVEGEDSVAGGVPP